MPKDDYTIEVFARFDKKGAHLDVRGLEPGRILTVHLKTPDRLGAASFIGTLFGVKPFDAKESVVQVENEGGEKT